MNRFFTAVAIAAVSATAATAEEITLGAPLQAGLLHENGVDMAVYYDETETGFAVVATYISHDRFSPARFSMTLADGDAVSFGLPGEPQAYYTFAREGADVSVSV